MTTCRPRRGYALVAAVAALALFGSLSLLLIGSSRGAIDAAAAEAGRVRAHAAADAGVAIALDNLLSDREVRWPVDGRRREVRFGDARLAIRIEDQHGKVAINRGYAQLVETTLQHAGLSGQRLRIARDSLLDWLDFDDEQRAEGAEAPYYARTGIAPRDAPLRSVDELARVRGFDAATVARLRGFVTTDHIAGSFAEESATPDAIHAQYGAAGAAVAVRRQKELAGQAVALDIASKAPLTFRPLAIGVEAVLPDGARARRVAVVELTGDRRRPYVVRRWE